MMMRRNLWLIILGIICSGCGVGEGTGSTPPWEAEEITPETATSKPAVAYSPSVEEEESYRVRMDTTKGDVVIAVVSDWAPRGAERFKKLVEAGFYDDTRIFRVVPGFVVQFGINGDPEVSKQWRDRPIKDDEVTQSNQTGYVTFATSGPDARTTQVFINLSNNSNLDQLPQNFAPFGKVVEGLDVVRSFHAEYEEAPTGMQQQITEQGNEFLDTEFPNLDSIKSITVIETPQAEEPGEAAASTDNEQDGSGR